MATKNKLGPCFALKVENLAFARESTSFSLALVGFRFVERLPPSFSLFCCCFHLSQCVYIFDIELLILLVFDLLHLGILTINFQIETYSTKNHRVTSTTCKSLHLFSLLRECKKTNERERGWLWLTPKIYHTHAWSLRQIDICSLL